MQHYRLGGKHWCQALDNQFLHSTMRDGLSFFRFDRERKGLWPSWKNIPYLAVSMELGPNGLCGFNALERLFDLNIDRWPDWSHGVSRDFWLSVSALGLKGFWLAVMIVWNCEFGKDRDQERKHQLGAVMAGIYRRYKPHDLPLDQARLAGIVSDYARQGVFFEGEASTEAAVWAHLQKTPFSSVGLSRCNLNRFMGSLHTAMHWSKRWSIDRFERETLGLEYDTLHSAKLLRKVNFAPFSSGRGRRGGGQH